MRLDPIATHAWDDSFEDQMKLLTVEQALQDWTRFELLHLGVALLVGELMEEGVRRRTYRTMHGLVTIEIDS